MQETIDHQRWWVQRWLELLDSYRFKKRLERGRNYAKAGNVLNIDFVGGKAIARVQGSVPQPYKVSLTIESFDDEAWGYVIETLAQRAIFSAQLLAGEMPATIEQVFIQNGLNLFPFSLSDVRSRCTCPDKANPCKHIAAVYYQLAARFNEDPFVIFQLRGRSKAEILAALQDYRREHFAGEAVSTQAIAPEKEITAAQTKHKKKTSLPSIDLEQFWGFDHPLDPDLLVLTPPNDGKQSLDLLGMMGLPPEDAETFQSYLNVVYGTASQKALMGALQGFTAAEDT